MKKINDFDYYITRDGKVINSKGKELKQCISTSGYYYVQLIIDKKKYMKFVHRLVAEMFIENKNEQVDHINGNKLDNNVENLRWVSARENYFNYGYKERIEHKKKKIIAIKDNKILEFNSRLECAEYFKCNKSKIKYDYEYKKGNKKGYIFKIKI